MEEVALELKTSSRTIRNYIYDKKIMAIKIGGAVRIERDELNRAIKDNTIGKKRSDA